MTWRAAEHSVPHESSGEDHLELMVSPVLRGKVLEEHDHLLEIKLLELI